MDSHSCPDFRQDKIQRDIIKPCAGIWTPAHAGVTDVSCGYADEVNAAEREFRTKLDRKERSHEAVQ